MRADYVSETNPNETNDKGLKNVDKVKIGIIGLGGIATRVHIPILRERRDTEIVAGAEIDDYQRERSQKRFNIRRVYSDYEQMMEKETLDAVYVCLPNHLHLDAVKAAISKNIHVYCEKPVGLSGGELSRISRANINNRIIMAGYNKRFNKYYSMAKEIVKSKSIGKLLQIQATSFVPGPYAGWDPKSEWYYNKENIGVLYDMGSHIVDLISFICEETFDKVSASCISSFPGLEMPDNIAFIMQNNRTICSVNIGWNTGRHYNSITIHGTSGSLVVYPDSIEHITPSSGGIDRVIFDLKNAREIIYTKIKAVLRTVSFGEEYGLINGNFIKSIIGIENPMISVEDALKVHTTLEAVKTSLECSSVISLVN